jgi:hypothetical protein
MTATRFEQDGVDVPIVIQGIGGDLRLRGRPGSWLIVDGDNPQVQQIGEDQPFIVRCAGDARITVPEAVNVSVQQVAGDAKITDITGQVDIKTVGSDLVIRNVKDVQVKMVGGDLRIKRADGNVTVETVGSDATIREIGGAVWVATVGSDLYMRNVGGSCVAERVGSDLVLSIDFLPEREYRFSAGSNVLCRVQPDANVRFVLPPEVDVQLDVAAEVTTDDDRQNVTLGDGSIPVHIVQANTLRLVGEEEDYMLSLGVQIEEELDARMSSLEEKLSQHLAHLAGLDDRFQAKAEQFASQAEKFARRAEREAERAAEQIRRGFERQTIKRKREAGPRRMRFTVDSNAASRSSEPISEQERLMILQMVRDNKISIEEAERLLAALDK